jgi:hypothetical protein
VYWCVGWFIVSFTNAGGVGICCCNGNARWVMAATAAAADDLISLLRFVACCWCSFDCISGVKGAPTTCDES